jgi:hypothetical protein
LSSPPLLVYGPYATLICFTSRHNSDSASDESSDISETENCTESEGSETKSEIESEGSETESDSDDEHVVQPPPHVEEEEEPEELNYDDILGGDDLDPAPIQAFAKDIPRVPGGIFFWRKRRVRKVRDELVLEKEAWDRQEMERFLKEQYVRPGLPPPKRRTVQTNAVGLSHGGRTQR